MDNNNYWIPILPFGGFLGGNIIGLIVLISRPTRPPAKLTFIII